MQSAEMIEAIAAAATARVIAPPNPWVGCVVVAADGRRFTGATSAPGGPHAEAVALEAAGNAARGASAFVTLEPCSHHGRTPPCADALIAAGVRRVVVAIVDPDGRVAGRGIDRLRAAGVEVELGDGAAAVSEQLAAYLHHRRTGRPYVVLKMASTLDGFSAAADGTSQWITAAAARADVHQLRHESDAILVGAGTVRSDDPSLTVRDLPDGCRPTRQPRRIVLGVAPRDAKVHPCTEMSGPLDPILDELGRDGVVQLMVEGGAHVAGEFHRAGLVDRYVWYVAPVMLGGDDGRAVFAGSGAPTLAAASRGRIVSVRPVGDDVRIDVVPCVPATGRDEPAG